jgi:hypothetical protein
VPQIRRHKNTSRPLHLAHVAPITDVVEQLLLVALLGSTFLVAFAGTKGTLALVFHLMTTKRLPITMHWKPVFFIVAVFWLWYLAPSVVESHTVARVMVLLAP